MTKLARKAVDNMMEKTAISNKMIMSAVSKRLDDISKMDSVSALNKGKKTRDQIRGMISSQRNMKNNQNVVKRLKSSLYGGDKHSKIIKNLSSKENQVRRLNMGNYYKKIRR